MDQFDHSKALFNNEIRIAVGVSGGPDSMAMSHVLLRQFPAIEWHFLTVNHKLRPESDAEARQVGAWLRVMKPNIRHHILMWDNPATSRIHEAARDARYRLMSDYCKQHKIKTLCLAHHLDDQMETILFRLAKGSGLDGLSGMQNVQPMPAYNLRFVRPFLEVGKVEILAYTKEHDIPYFEDISNANTDYARPRLRQARSVLEQEGLTPERLGHTAKRLRRATDALDQVADRVFQKSSRSHNDMIAIDSRIILQQPEEIILRVILRAIYDLTGKQSHDMRLRRIEQIVDDLISTEPFRKRTFAGLCIQKDENEGRISLSRE